MKTTVKFEESKTAKTACARQGFKGGLHRFSRACRESFQSLKEKVADELNETFAAAHPELVRQAVNEAAALAATTAFPNLFLPALAEEKVLFASQWQMKQERILREQSWLQAA